MGPTTTLVFQRGSRVDRCQCLFVDTFTVYECREDVQFNMTITGTTPAVQLQEPLLASVLITDANTSCICPGANTTPPGVCIKVNCAHTKLSLHRSFTG